MSKRKTTEQFVKEAEEKFPGKFDLSGTVYNGARQHLQFVFKECGHEGSMTADNLLRRKGCRVCSVISRSSERIVPFKEFEARAKETHKGKYLYLECSYTKASDSVGILCGEHGVFRQQGTAHLIGNGCSKCATLKAGLTRRITSEDFFKRCREKHKGRYDYTSSTYSGAERNITYVCPEHGEFTQNAHAHKSGNGCRHCAELRGAMYFKHRTLADFEKVLTRDTTNIYLIKLQSKEEGTFYKVGLTNNILARFTRIKDKNRFSLQELQVFEGNAFTLARLEYKIHQLLSGKEVLFSEKFSGHTECFYLTGSDLSVVHNLLKEVVYE